MDWSRLYKEPQKTLWKGRSDGPGGERFHEIIQLVDLRKNIPASSNKSTFGILGFASDLGIERNKGRLGAAKGPEAIRKSLSSMPAPDPQKITLYDFGDIVCERDLEQAQMSLGIVVAMLLAQGIRPIVLGGGHEVAWGNYRGIATFDPKLNISIINFDAHYDLRPLENDLGTSGTSFRQIYELTTDNSMPFDYTVVGLQPQSNTRLLHNYASSLGVKVITAEQITTSPTILDTVNPTSPIYLTICMDVFRVQGVSAPQSLGLLPSSIIPLLRRLSSKVLTFDIAEVSPPHDDGSTASLAATLISIYIDSNLHSI